MGLLSKLQDALEEVARPDGYVLEDFGEPARTLYTALDIGDLHRRIDITDEDEAVQYYTKSSVFALKGKTDIFDYDDNLVAHLEKKPVSLHEKHFITMADGRSFTLSNELLHVIKDITNIEGLGWRLHGNIVGLNFNLWDENGEPVATIGKKLISIHDKYSINLYKPEHEQVVVAIVISLEKMLEDRRENESSSSVSFSFGD